MKTYQRVENGVVLDQSSTPQAVPDRGPHLPLHRLSDITTVA